MSIIYVYQIKILNNGKKCTHQNDFLYSNNSVKTKTNGDNNGITNNNIQSFVNLFSIINITISTKNIIIYVI